MRSLGGRFLLYLFLVIFLLPGYAEASITLKITVVNPSEQKQSVPIKVYLPVEVKPQDIIYKEDLEVAYDTQLGSHYVFGEYEIEPLGVLEREIEVSDIWVIPDLEIESLRQDAKKLKASSEKTEVGQSIALIYNAIDKKLNEIAQLQKIPAVSPTQHISDYRYCLGVLGSVKNDLAQGRILLAQVPAKPGLAATVWKIIIFVIIFLGILGSVSYIIWQRQAKLIKEITPAESGEDISLTEKPAQQSQYKPKEEKPTTPEDIEKIIREG
jgi:hypothetical protein